MSALYLLEWCMTIDEHNMLISVLPIVPAILIRCFTSPNLVPKSQLDSRIRSSPVFTLFSVTCYFQCLLHVLKRALFFVCGLTNTDLMLTSDALLRTL